uniref:Uncharacterized protein n=1 Tax=Meleagris gallopavo TaxID=9103 RepID=A0A803YSF2_MELGA
MLQAQRVLHSGDSPGWKQPMGALWGPQTWASVSSQKALPVQMRFLPVWTDCEGLCWNLAGRGLGEKPHADSYSAGQFSASFGSFTQPCTQWLHKADYKLQRIPEGAKSDAGANEPREPLIPVTEWDKLGKARTTQIQGSPGSTRFPWRSATPFSRAPRTLLPQRLPHGRSYCSLWGRALPRSPRH